MRTLSIAVWLNVMVASGLLALDVKSLTPEGHVSDFARVLDPATKAQIENYCRRVKEATKAEIAIVTIRRLDEEPIADVANALYRQWGIGGKATNEGVLFLISMEERRTRLEVGYGLEAVIPDGFLGGMLREIRPSMREKRYGEALSSVAQILGSRIAAAKGVTIPDTLSRRRRAEPEGLPWPLIIIGIVVALMVLSSIGGGGRGLGSGRGGIGLPFPVFLPGGFGGRGSGGGGFGGYDSGDSGGGFGGFGGGDSGGGGASGDW